MKALLPLLCLLTTSLAIAETTLIVESGPNRRAVVELYTSEGCSSCPPADRWLKELADMPADEVEVMPLAFHVDYWDYIGWKDEFATPLYTARQRELADRNALDSVYTPAFFVDGRETRGVFRILSAIRDANASPAPIQLRMSLTPSADSLRIHLNNRFLVPGNYLARLVVFENELGNMIKRGENSGKYLQHQRVVRHLGEPFRLAAENTLDLPLRADWQRDKLGVGLIVRDAQHKPAQSLFTLLGAN